MAKLYVSESFVKSCLDAIQMHGGSGCTTELELECELHRNNEAQTEATDLARMFMINAP